MEDGYGGSTENTDPVLSITPDTAVNIESLLTCGYTASDADGDTPTPTYVWTNLTTGVVYSLTSETLQLSARIPPLPMRQCSVVTDSMVEVRP